jgi:hypothetical protein
MHSFPDEIYIVMDLLKRYISIHNEVFNMRWWRNIPIPGIFKPLEFPRLRDELGLIVTQLACVLVSPVDERMPSVFGDYVDALLRTVDALQDICSRLAVKMDGVPYPWKEYHSDVQSYKALVNEYRELGTLLNQQLGVAY